MAKQAHWNLVGPRFRALHLHLDEITDELREQSDIIAERSVQIGIFVDGQSGHVAEHTELDPLPQGAIADERAIELLDHKVEATERGGLELGHALLEGLSRHAITRTCPSRTARCESRWAW